MSESAPFLVDAGMITDFQSCRRKYLLSRRWRPVRWNHKVLFDSCLRQGIVELGSGEDLKTVLVHTSTRFMDTAAGAGLNVVGFDPYTLAQDYVSMLETILTALGKRSKYKLSPVPSIPLARDIEWSVLAYADEHGELHRTITVDRWNEDRLAQEMHGWMVFGDIAATKKPLHLHVIEIGQLRDGRRHSPWTRAWQHEFVSGRLRFQKKVPGGKGGYTKLEGAWEQIFLADSTKYNAESWVEFMEQDNIVDMLIHDVEIAVPRSEHIKSFIRDISIEVQQMRQWEESIENPFAVPMSRAACDNPYACQFQPCCFSPLINIDVGSIGLYKPR